MSLALCEALFKVMEAQRKNSDGRVNEEGFAKVLLAIYFPIDSFELKDTVFQM